MLTLKLYAMQATGVWVVSQAAIFEALHNTPPQSNETKMDACVCLSG